MQLWLRLVAVLEWGSPRFYIYFEAILRSFTKDLTSISGLKTYLCYLWVVFGEIGSSFKF